MKSLIVAAFILFIAASSAVAEDIDLQNVDIVLDNKASRKLEGDKKSKAVYAKAFAFGCDKLGKALLAGKGPWGYGVFQDFTCYRGKKKIKGLGSKPAKWLIKITDGVNKISFRLSFISEARTSIDLGTVEFPAAKSFFKFFLDAEFVDLLAMSILERLPIGMQIVKAGVQGSPPQFKGRYISSGKASRFKFKNFSPAKDLVIYSVAWDEIEKAWRSQVIGSAKSIKINEPQKKKSKRRTLLQGGEVIYETSDEVSTRLSQGPLWAQNAGGPGARSSEIEAIIDEAVNLLQKADDNGKLLEFIAGKIPNLLDLLLETAGSGYVGMRFGLQALSGDPLLGKLKMFGLLVELRAGPVKGLRYYYDKVPTAKVSQPLSDLLGGGKIQTSIESARHVLGYSFDFDPGFLVSRVTIDPKLGMWTFRAVLPSEADDQGKVFAVKEFELGNTFSIALEVGLEILSNWYTLRGWYAIDTGFSLLKTGGRVTSNRFGLDGYFTAGPSFPIFGVPFKTALMSFFVLENVSLSSTKVAEAAPGEKEIKGVSYLGGFAGGGIGVTW